MEDHSQSAPIGVPPPPPPVPQEAHTDPVAAPPSPTLPSSSHATPLKAPEAAASSAGGGAYDELNDSPQPKQPTTAHLLPLASPPTDTETEKPLAGQVLQSHVVQPPPPPASAEAVLRGRPTMVQGTVVGASSSTSTGAIVQGNTTAFSLPTASRGQQNKRKEEEEEREQERGKGEQRLSSVQRHLQQMRDEIVSKSLMARYVLQNAIPGNVAEAAMSAGGRDSAPRFKNKLQFRRKIILLGYQEVGKTSLRKCFESEPFFFKNLPEVRATTGVEVQEKHMYVDGDDVEVIMSDFAGQEAYHSHTYFLTSRSIFLLVWKISAIEQDFQSSGINSREEERLQHWIAEVLAKFPHARIVLVATHLDELRVQGQRSVEMILTKVERKLRTFIDGLITATTATSPPSAVANAAVLSRIGDARKILVGNFAVSCKSRLIIAAGDTLRHMSGEKISDLLRHLGLVAKEDCLADREYPSAAIPGRHARLIETVEEVKRRHPVKLLMRMGELAQMAVRLGIESGEELMQVARLMHSWDILYLFDQYTMEEDALVVLYPRWLNRMSASLFSYAHLLRTPLHLRSMIGGLEYTVSQAEMADQLMMRKGFLRWPLARVLFHKPLVDFLRRPPDDSDVAMCLELLEKMQVLYPVQVACDEFSVLVEETPVNSTSGGRPIIRSDKLWRYYIPSLAPVLAPSTLKKLAPVLFHRGVRARYEFNFLPDELWWRLQCALAPYVKPVTVYQPNIEVTEEEELLCDGFRLREADEEHNRWRDAVWMAGDSCRVLIYREGLTAISILSAENATGGSGEVLQLMEGAFLRLLREYQGVERRVLMSCPNPECDGWLEATLVASCATVDCPACHKAFASKEVILSSQSADQDHPPPFTQSLLAETGELLAFCLAHQSCLELCRYLGIPYKGPSPSRPPTEGEEQAEAAAGEAPQETAHMDYLHALDKVVQAELFRSWMQRAEEYQRRRRMLEEEPVSALF